jgi:diguanylate cyclase (GGDEF)-like protein/PAS domain S-box-containing protein
LSSVFDAVARTGDHRQRANWESEDEIGRLVRGFNDMLSELDHAREEQQELASAARASEAQRALLEVTPIAMVVTAIPGHEVLHANAPAEYWLDSSKTDPWAKGLEPSVRARFFQQLADWGAVDEFEVLWQQGTERTWAVLSARRLTYQGQDAMLSSFTSVNHLKQMERRLELWAKVYEVSSEGIIIVDAQRQVVSANEAFLRSTGHERGGVTGLQPESLFEESSESLTAMWVQVQARGSWQGEFRMRRRMGPDFPAWVMASGVREPHGEGISHFIFTCIDVSDRKKSEERIHYLAHHDVLTGLPNRTLCMERLDQALQRAKQRGSQAALLFVDLDRFKDINDSLGHHVGDRLLQSVAQRLSEAVRAGDTVSRLGGDEFVLVLSDVRGTDEVAQIVENRLIPAVRQLHSVSGHALHVSCSVGIAMYPRDAADLEALMQHADTAMYEAKSQGRDGARFYDLVMTERAQQRLSMESALRQAAAGKGLTLHWQPRVHAGSGAPKGVEGLLRWNHEVLGQVPPAQFIPVAEETGMIIPIGAWVIEEACRQIHQWATLGCLPQEVSVNVSALQLRQPGLVEHLRACLIRYQVPFGTLELELTESVLMDSAEANLARLREIRDLGVRLVIDDFGTGYSSLNYLNRFPIDRLKIDRSFVSGMLEDSAHLAVIHAVIGLGHSLGLSVVAEGVETLPQAQALHEAHCEELQGYYFGRPMNAEAFTQWMAHQTGKDPVQQTTEPVV